MKRALLLGEDDKFMSQLAYVLAEVFPGIGIDEYRTLDPAQLHTRHFDIAISSFDLCDNSTLVLTLIRRLSANGTRCIATSHSCDAVITALQAGAKAICSPPHHWTKSERCLPTAIKRRSGAGGDTAWIAPTP